MKLCMNMSINVEKGDQNGNAKTVKISAWRIQREKKVQNPKGEAEMQKM